VLIGSLLLFNSSATMASTIPSKVLFKKLEKELREYLPEDYSYLLDECMRFLNGCSTFRTHRAVGVKLCQNYDLSPEELRWKWETVKHLSRETHRLDVSMMGELKRCIVQEQAKASRPTNKGPGARLSGVMSARSGASGYGPGRILRQPDGAFMSGVKKEDVNRPVPVAGSSKISFSQVDKVERRDCEYSIGATFPCTELMPLQIVTCTRNCQRGVMVRIPPDFGTTIVNGFSIYKVLDERIDDMAEIVRLHYNIQELCDPASATEVLPLLPLIVHS